MAIHSAKGKLIGVIGDEVRYNSLHLATNNRMLDVLK